MSGALAPGSLLERDRELTRIAGRLASARAGDGGLTVIEGPAGIGKTSLVRAVRAQADQAGMQVLDGRGAELEHDFAFGVVRQAFERPLMDLDPDVRAAVTAGPAAHAAALFDPAGSAASSEAALHGLYWLVANLAERRPVVLAIDDAHWADESSLAALAFLSRRVEQLAVALVVSTRPPGVDRRPSLSALLADPLAEHLTLGPLGETAVAAISGSDDPAFVHAVAHATGGNPFLIEQLLRELGPERSPEAVARVEPRGLGRAVLARISDRARALAWALVVLGDRATLVQCVTLAGVDAPADAVDELVASGILADEERLRFRHPLIAAAVAAGLPAAHRAQWHARAAAMLRDGGADAERVAVHLAAGEPAASTAVVEVLLDAAGRAVARGAPMAAEPLLRRALAEPPDDRQRPRVLLALGEVVTVTGEDEAASLFAEVVRSSDDARLQTRALEARARVGWARAPATTQGDLAEIDRLIVALPAEAGDLRMRLEAARLAVAQRSPTAMADAVARAERIGLLSEQGTQHPDVLAQAAHWLMQTGHSAQESVGYALRAAEAARGTYRAMPPGLWFPFTTIVLQLASRFPAASANARSLQQATRECGSPTWYGLATQWQARLLRDGGDLVAAEEEARLAVDAAGAADEEWMRALPTRTLVSILLDRGQPSQAAHAWSLLALGETIPDTRPMTELLVTRAQLRDAHGDRAGALHDLRETARRFARSGPPSMNDQEARLHTAVLEHATGDHEAANAIADTAVAIAERWDTPGAIGAALRVQAVVNDDVGLLRSAVDRLTDSPLRLEQARATADLGGALRRRGARRDARESLLASLAIARDCGADGLATHIGEELEASGARVPRRAPAGSDALTPSERRITRMAVQGTSNKEIAQALFLSVKTIEMHLHHAYRKLDIGSRRELAAAFTAGAW